MRWPTVNRKDMNLSNFKNSNYRIRFCESVEFKTTWATETPGLVMGANMMRPSFRSGKYIPEKHFNLVWFNENSLYTVAYPVYRKCFSEGHVTPSTTKLLIYISINQTICSVR